MFVTFEGIDGCGKSTQAELLAKSLRADGHDVVALREPGGTPLGERIRELLLDGPEMGAWAEAALFAAARAELVERVIRPALARRATVVCDRYVDSSLVYQGVGRGLGIEPVFEVNAVATGGLLPDRTFVLLLDPEESRERMTGARDRIEREDDAFVRRLDEGYRKIVSMFPERCIAIDASRPPDEIAEEVRDELARSDTRAVRGQATA
jgi:dTMP kinase